MLWDIPPTRLTERHLNRLVLFIRYIRIKLSSPPASEKSILAGLNKNPIRNILSKEITKASFAPIQYINNITTTLKFQGDIK